MEAVSQRSQGSLSLLGCLAETGHKAEEDVKIWSQGLAFHYANLLDGLAEVDESKKEKLLTDIWTRVAEKAPDAIKEKLDFNGAIDLNKIKETLSRILSDPDHPAIKGSGKDVNESMLNWVKLFALVDFNIYMRLEHHLGTKDGYPIYMGLWEKFALAELDEVKKALGISGPDDVNMDKLGELSQIYWETIACPYRVTVHDDNTHEAEILACPYWDNMREMLGEETARSMTLKCEAAVSTNYYESVLKALGVFDRFAFTMDKFICCGDGVCRVRFTKR
ncbi:MAG: hypothetical protein LJE96_02565 [Deltaproteobacteria bacterium]|jgi:hypothetical protein|nr:hypothetical protein [Deltaproteobacteria bacterium]